MKREFKCIFVEWERAYEICKRVCASIGDAAFVPEVVVGISRGGLFLARVICDFFRLKDLLCVKIEHWGVTATITGEAEMRYGLDENAKCALMGKHVIIADDITDTGESLRIAAEYVRSLGVEEVRTATMHHKSVSSFVPDFYGERIEKWVWVIYPWSFYEDLSNLIKNLLSSTPPMGARAANVEDIRDALQSVYGLQMTREKLEDVIDNMVFHGEIELCEDVVLMGYEEGKRKGGD